MNNLQSKITKLWELYRDKKFKKLISIGEGILALKNDKNAEFFKIMGLTHDQLALSVKDVKQKKDLQKKGIYYFKEILTNNPKSIDAYKGLGLVALHQDKLKESLSHYKKAYLLDKNNLSVYISLANVYRAMGKYSLALNWYQKSLKSKMLSDKIVALTNIAIMMADQKRDIISAKKYAKQALRLISKNKKEGWMSDFERKLKSILDR